jgi:hypothetical protein
LGARASRPQNVPNTQVLIVLDHLVSGFKPGATERPITSLLTESSFHRIILDVPDRIQKMSLVSNQAIKILSHPKLSGAVKNLVGFMSRVRLNRMQDVAELIVFEALSLRPPARLCKHRAGKYNRSILILR